MRVDEMQYLGRPGITASCIRAITSLIQCGEDIKKAKLLSSGTTHAFILLNHLNQASAIRSGFSSGYTGEGPRGLATALQILYRHDIEIEEFEVDRKFIDKLNSSSLKNKDLDKLFSMRPVLPRRWDNYIFHFENCLNPESQEIARHYPTEIPFGLIDSRIVDLAIRFSEDCDAAVVGAYRRLEDIVRQRTGLEESGSKLFSKAFLVDDAPLKWTLQDQAETKGRANLFSSVYTAFRNPRAHRERTLHRNEELREFLLINELFVLESKAIQRESKSDA